MGSTPLSTALVNKGGELKNMEKDVHADQKKIKIMRMTDVKS